ncbi:MAG TPA: hypothetical protein VK787_02480, partial [Puia sp.]|nr:hypothetical protein [Puia sp.]
FFVTGICSFFSIVVSLTCTVEILFNYGPNFGYLLLLVFTLNRIFRVTTFPKFTTLEKFA